MTVRGWALWSVASVGVHLALLVAWRPPARTVSREPSALEVGLVQLLPEPSPSSPPLARTPIAVKPALLVPEPVLPEPARVVPAPKLVPEPARMPPVPALTPEPRVPEQEDPPLPPEATPTANADPLVPEPASVMADPEPPAPAPVEPSDPLAGPVGVAVKELSGLLPVPKTKSSAAAGPIGTAEPAGPPDSGGTGERDPGGPGGDDGFVEAAPQYGRTPLPRYPRVARGRGWEGEVLLWVRVSETGRVTDVRVERSSSHRVLDDAAAAALRTWRFVPATRNDRPMASTALVPVRFDLRARR